MTDQMQILPIETWELVIDQIMDLDPTNRIVYIIWLMQVSKVFSTIVRGYFERRGVKPHSFYPTGKLQNPFGTHVLAEREYRYGVEVHYLHRYFNLATVRYKIVHKRKAVELLFRFCADRVCNEFEYTRPEYCYRVDLEEGSPTEAQRISKSLSTTGYIVKLVAGKVSSITAGAHGKHGSYIQSDSFIYARITSELCEVFRIMLPAMERVKEELYRGL